MQTDRRSVLKAGGVLAALGTTGLAGCSGFLGGGDAAPGDYRYDPSVLAETENKFFGNVDYAGLYEARENFPESTRESFESAEDSPVAPEEIDTFTGVAGAQIAIEDAPSSSVFGSMALLGSFEASAVQSDLEADGAQESGEYEGFTLYENVDESSPGDIADGGEGSAVAAVRDGVAIFGAAGSEGGSGAGVTGRQAAETMIDAGNGDVDRLEATSDRAGQLTDRFGDANVMVGGQVDPALVETAMAQGQQGAQTQFINGVRAGGFGMTVEGTTTTMTLALLYTDAERAENSGVQELADLASQQAVENNPGLDSVEAEYDGNAAVVTVEGETETIFEEGASAGTGGGLAVAEPARLGVSPVPEP